MGTFPSEQKVSIPNVCTTVQIQVHVFKLVARPVLFNSNKQQHLSEKLAACFCEESEDGSQDNTY